MSLPDVAGRNLLLSFLPHFGDPLAGPGLEERLLRLVQGSLSLLAPSIGRWSVVWGPAVYRVVPLGFPDNIMLVLENEARTERFVSIAGTNPLSLFAWFVENFQVDEMFPWGGGAPGDATISEGTLQGFRALRGMVPPSGVPGAHQTLLDFLGGAAPCPLTVGGHSLGGVLASVLGLWLHDTAPGAEGLSVWSYAAPAPGNAAFAAHARERLGGRLHRIYNSLDIVPSGWQVDDLARLKAIYAPRIERSALWDSVIDVTIAATNGHRFAQLGDGLELPGALRGELIGGRSALTDIVVQLLYQHTVAYFPLTGVSLAPALDRDLARLRARELPGCERSIRRRLRQESWAQSARGIPGALARYSLHQLRRSVPALLRAITPTRR